MLNLDLTIEYERLTREQDVAVNTILAEIRNGGVAALNDSEPGAGKTSMTARVIREAGFRRVLIIAPKGTEEGWRDEFSDMEFIPINSDTDGLTRLYFQEEGVFFVGREMFGRMSETHYRDKQGKRRFKTTGVWEAATGLDCVVSDEHHEGSLVKDNVMYRAFERITKAKPGFKMALSGTPVGGNFEGAHPLTYWLWGASVVPASKEVWIDLWCATTYDHFSYSKRKVTGELNPGAFFNSLPCRVRVKAPYIPIDDQVVEVDLYENQRKAYDELEAVMATWVEENLVTAELPIVQRIRLRQATLGMFTLRDTIKLVKGEPEVVSEILFPLDCESSKIDAMFRVLEEDFEGEPAVIMTDSRKFAEVVVHRLNQAGLSAEPWWGGISQKKRDVLKGKFKTGEVKYVVMVIKAGKSGVNGLQHGSRNLLYLSADDSLVNMEQSVARVRRAGAIGLVRVRRIHARGTYDEGIFSGQLERAIALKKSLSVRGA